jgi:hypothetical protein
MPRFDQPVAPMTLGKMRELGVRPTGCAKLSDAARSRQARELAGALMRLQRGAQPRCSVGSTVA